MANGPVPSVDVLVAENARLRVELDAAAVLVGQLIGATAAFEARLSAFQEQASSQAERIATLEALVAEPRRGGKRQAAPFSKGGPTSRTEVRGPQEGQGPWQARPSNDPDR